MSESKWGGRKSSTARAHIAATLPRPCYRCGHTIPDADTAKAMGISWDVEHLVSRAEGGTDGLENYGVSHSTCNRSAGGKLAASRKAATKIVRTIEAERTHKFWRIAEFRTQFSFPDVLRIVLGVTPTFFVSVAVGNE